ncbi:MAG: YdgA family protein [Colwelliaceae bacterium]|nr:YdgA family protein [Colwelliaceae bacterium]
MKKLVLSICGLTVAAALITPKMVSVKVEKQINNIVKEINDAYGYTATISNLESKWFSTSGKIRISIDVEQFSIQDAPAELEDAYLDFDIQAQHGPILTNGDNALGLFNMSLAANHDKLREYLNWAEESPIYGLKLFTDITGNTSYKDVIQAFSMSDTENSLDIKFEGYQGAGTFSNGALTYQGTSNESNITLDNANMKIGEIEMSMVADASIAELFQTGLYDSDSKISVKSINIIDESKAMNAKLDNIYIEAISKVDNVKNSANIAITYGVDTIETNDFNAKDVALALEINNISKAFVTAYQENTKMFTEGTEEEIQENILKFAQDNLLTFLKAEPQINITSLRATLDEGTFESHINTSVVGITQVPKIMEDPMFWLPHLLANGEVKGSKAVIEYIAATAVESQIKADPQAANMTDEQIKQIAAQQVPQFLQGFIQQGFIIENQSGYQTNFVFKDKALTVNNKPIPLPI